MDGTDGPTAASTGVTSGPVARPCRKRTLADWKKEAMQQFPNEVTDEDWQSIESEAKRRKKSFATFDSEEWQEVLGAVTDKTELAGAWISIMETDAPVQGECSVKAVLDARYGNDHNGYTAARRTLKNGMTFDEVGLSFPVIGRSGVVKRAEDALTVQFEVWEKYQTALAAASEESMRVEAEEVLQREYRNTFIVGATALGKTTVAKQVAFGERKFLWDLARKPVASIERELEYETLVALRILHAAANGGRAYDSEFLPEALSRGLGRMTLADCLEHIHGGGAARTKTYLIVDECQSAEKEELTKLMHAVYKYHWKRSRHFLGVVYVGSEKDFMLDAFRVSGVTGDRLPVDPLQSSDFSDLISELGGQSSDVVDAAVAELTGNMRLMALFVWAMGTEDGKFSVERMQARLTNSSQEDVNRARVVVTEKVNKEFQAAVDTLQEMGADGLTQLLVAVLSEWSVPVHTTFGGFDVATLQRKGCVYVRNNGALVLPFVLIVKAYTYLSGLKGTGLEYVTLLNGSKDPSTPRLNELTDLGVVLLRFYRAYLLEGNKKVKLCDLFGVTGPTAQVEVELSGCLLEKPTELGQNVTVELLARLDVGAYVGHGTDAFADSFLIFLEAGGQRRKVILLIESKRHEGKVTLTTEYVNEHRDKCTPKIPEHVLAVFFFITDQVDKKEEVEAEDDEAIYTAGNMQTLYGSFLASKRRAALYSPKVTL